jgi:hypothetical protein
MTPIAASPASVDEESLLSELWRAIFDKDEARAIEAIDRGAPVLASWQDLVDEGPMDPQAARHAWLRRLRKAADGFPSLSSHILTERDALGAASCMRLPLVVERLIERQNELSANTPESIADLDARRERALRIALVAPHPIHGWREASARLARVADALLASQSVAPWLAAEPDTEGAEHPWLAELFKRMSHSGASEAAWGWLARTGALARRGAREALGASFADGLIRRDAVGQMAILVGAMPSLADELRELVARHAQKIQRSLRAASAARSPIKPRDTSREEGAIAFVQNVSARVRSQPSEPQEPSWSSLAWDHECSRCLALGDMPAAQAAVAHIVRLAARDEAMGIARADKDRSASGHLAEALVRVWDLGVGRCFDAEARGAGEPDLDSVWARLCALIAEPGRGGQGWPADPEPEKESATRKRARAKFFQYFISPPSPSNGVDGEQTAMGRAGLAALQSGLFDTESFFDGMGLFCADYADRIRMMSEGGKNTEAELANADRGGQAKARAALEAAIPSIRRAAGAAGEDPDLALAEHLRRAASHGHWRPILVADSAGLANPGELDVADLALSALHGGQGACAERLLLLAIETGRAETLARDLPAAFAMGESVIEERLGNVSASTAARQEPAMRAAMAAARRVADSVSMRAELRGVVTAASASAGAPAHAAGASPEKNGAGSFEPAERSRKRL